MLDSVLYGEHLVSILRDEKTCFLKCEPIPTDFTKPGDFILSVASKKASLKIPLKEQLDFFVHLLAIGLFTTDRTVIAWDSKPLLTYLKANTKSGSYEALNLNRLVDLKLAEAFLGIQLSAPSSWAEAMKRLKTCMEAVVWKIHRKIHVPLATHVVPDMETCGVVDDVRKQTLFPSYTIEGQVHGRMSCHIAFDRCINPHSLDEQYRQSIKPRSPFSHFIQLDYRGHEVAVLGWLSKDEKINAIVADHSKDLYVEIFKTIADVAECSSEERDLAKGFFLPVFYGMQSFALSQKLGITQTLAEQIIGLIAQKFPTAWQWAAGQHEQAKATGKLIDYFGRSRDLQEPYLARWASIAAPAALICMERLVQLHAGLPSEARLVFSIHDGYLLATSREHLTKTVHVARQILEDEIPLCPGLKLRVSADAGKTLGKMVRLF